jgi:ATP-dependent RNA helicase TDRD9
LKKNFSKGTYIERDSINYVALDDEIESKCRRLLVAAEVTLNASANRVILRKTSLMPKIMGLSSIMCLLFTPTCEVRLSPDSKSFTGALCGLGFDRVTKRPLYTDNDIECVFDVNIDCNEFAEINTVRRAINMCIGSHENALEWTTSKRNLRRLQKKARDKLLSLVQRERMPTEIKQFHKPGRWDQVS